MTTRSSSEPTSYQGLPSTPKSYSKLVTKLVDNTTPIRQNMLRKAGIRPLCERKAVEETLSGVKKLTLSIKGKRSKKFLAIRDELSCHLFSTEHKNTQASRLNVSLRDKILQKYHLHPRKYGKYKGGLSYETIQKILNFYKDPKDINRASRKALWWKATYVNVS